MNAFPDPVFQGAPSGFDSRDCVDLFLDGPGDTTVRPMRTKLRQLVLAERERLARLREQIEQRQATDEPDAKNGAQ